MKERFGPVQPEFTNQQYGQMEHLRKHLGELTRDLVELLVDPVNWWHFCHQIRAEDKHQRISNYPDIGLLLSRRGTALRAIRSKLSNSPAGAEFIKKAEQKEYDGLKALLVAVYAEGKPERLAKIEAAKTLADMQRMFIELTDEDTAA
jgi:hypothetical protein